VVKTNNMPKAKISKTKILSKLFVGTVIISLVALLFPTQVVLAVPPTVGIVVADTALKAGETSGVTFTFSEVVAGFTNDDLTIASGTLDTVTSADGGTTWTAILTPTPNIEDATNVITINMTGVADVAGNPGVGTTNSNNYAIDTLRPTVGIVLSDYDIKIGDTATVTFTFSEAPTGFTTADVTVGNGAITDPVGGPLIYTATYTPTADTKDTTNVITVGTNWTDAAGNAPAAVANSANYEVDTSAPTGGAVIISAAPTAPAEKPAEKKAEEVVKVVKPITQMTIAELKTEIVRITALIAQLQVELAKLIGAPVLTLDVNLKYNGSGDDVKLLQTWLAKDPKIYPKALVTGWFGPLTKAAVIRFQEKYADEGLAPWGITKGTGFVGSTTREKLNALYSGK